MIEISGKFNTAKVYTNSLDESPMAYKSIDDIVANIEPTARILKRIKPVYNYKAFSATLSFIGD